MKELIIALYGLVVLFVTEKPLKEAFAAFKVPSLKRLSKSLPSLERTMEQAVRGNFDYEQLGEELRVYALEYGKSPEARVAVRTLLSAFSLWMRTLSEPAFNLIHRNASSRVFPSWIATHFTREEINQTDVQKKLRSVMEQMTGGRDLGFKDVELAKQKKIEHPELYSEYLKLRRKFNDSWKIFLSNLIRQSGNKTIPMKEALTEFKKNNIVVTWPTGYSGRVDADGNWYTRFDEFVGSPPSGVMFPTVRMNESYKKGASDYVYQGMRADGKPGNYFYTRDAVRRAVANKFKKVNDFIPLVPKIRAKWVTMIKQFDVKDKRKVAALVLELLYRTSARIGSNTKNNGMCTLLVKNYAAIPNGFRLKYLGKANVPTLHKVVGTDPLTKLIVKIVADLAENKGPKDRLFTFQNEKGKLMPLMPVTVNNVFRALGAIGITVHKLRTYHGTTLFNEECQKVFDKVKSFPSTKAALNAVKEIALKVGKQLNHVRMTSEGTATATPATALGSYIDRMAQIAFFQHYQLPLPNYLDKTIIDARVMITAAVEKIEEEGAVGRDDPSVTEEDIEHPEPKPVEEPSKKEVKKFDKEEELSEKEEEQLRKVLEKSAERVSYRFNYGGDSSDSFADEVQEPDNLIVNRKDF